MNKTFGQTLKELRKEQGYTLKELALRSSLSIMTISNLEHDRYKPRSLTVMKLKYPLQCEIYMVGKNLLLRRKENKNGN